MIYRHLSIPEYGSVGCFLVGRGLGVVYLEMWSVRQASLAEQEELARLGR